MIVSNRHVAKLNDLNDKEIIDLHRTANKMISSLSQVLKPQGFNLGINLGGIAGAGIKDHLHLHIVPRWSGDTNFMPICAETKIISQSLKELYLKITKTLTKNGKKRNKK